MSILERPLLRPAQRFDLEDWEVLLSALRTDAKFWHSRFMSEKSYIIQGFKIDEGFIGQSTCEIDLETSTLINADSAADFSWYASQLSPDPITIPSGVGGLQPGRNFVELVLNTLEGTPLQKAFWDPSANSGLGVEFTQEVTTTQYITLTAEVNQVSFNIADPDKIQLAIIDVDGSGNIQGIQDKRELFYRLGQPDDTTRDYPWGSKEEPTVKLTFTVPSGTAFVEGEEVGFTSGATATVVVGGTQDVEVYLVSNVNYEPGDSVVGASSGASATLESYYESFVGADKDIANMKDMLDALMTEIKALKGTNFWFETGPAISLPSLLSFVNTFMVPLTSGARFRWSGTALSITDNQTSGQATSDVLAALRTPGLSTSVYLTRQDGAGGSATLAIPDGNLLYVELPDSGNRTYSESGPGSTNYIVISRGSFVPSDKKFVIAYREGSKLILPGSGELEPGEEGEISDETPKAILAYIGASSEADDEPQYTTVPAVDLSNQFSVGDSLTQAISINAANINDIVQALLAVYYEPLYVTSLTPADDNEVAGPLTSGDFLTLPLDSRNSNAAKSYLVGSGALFLFRNGQMLNLGEDYLEVGSVGTLSDQVQILLDIPFGERFEFKLVTPEVFGTASLPQAFFLNYLTGQNGGQIPAGGIYNVGSDKLSVYRNGLAMLKTSLVGDSIDQFQEVNNNSVSLSENANSDEVFTFVNRANPAPTVTLITGVTGTVLTIPTYTLGDDRLMIYRNGILLNTDGSSPADLHYAETSTTSVTLDIAATISDVFQVYNAGAVHQFREVLTGVTGAVLTIPSAQTYTIGDQHLLVFRNGVLMLNSNSPALATSTDRYQETGTDEITVEDAAIVSDVFEFLYI